MPSGRPELREFQQDLMRLPWVTGRTLEEEADADRGRVLFSAPFRRLQNKAQVFSLESNAAVRSRLTHSLEVSSIGRFVAQQAIKSFSGKVLDDLGISGKERPLITFVETACLLHDLGNPPFGHFGELALSDWFHLHASNLIPSDIGGHPLSLWQTHYGDFPNFDGNPQGFRITTRLQPSETNDLNGMNLTATTLAATLKYPWTSNNLTTKGHARKKAGYFHTEKEVVDWICKNLEMSPETRHPLVYLMEAADDIAYCISDIEDGIEKGLISCQQFADAMLRALGENLLRSTDVDLSAIGNALTLLKDPVRLIDGVSVERLTIMQDLRSAAIRYLARHAGATFRDAQEDVLRGTAKALLSDCEASPLLHALQQFAASSLYSSTLVRNRELTAQAVLSGLLDAYSPVMSCEVDRFKAALCGGRRDNGGQPIARESSLVARISKKHLAVYHESVRRMQAKPDGGGVERVMERIYRIRMVVDHISGMTDEFALQSYQHIWGVHINPYRN